MKFVLSKEFADHILADFTLGQGSFNLIKVEAVNPDDEVYIFMHGYPYFREGEDKPEIEVAPAYYALYITDHAPDTSYLTKLATDWYGKELLEVVGCNKELTEILIRIDPPAGYWSE